ncbi:MAG TPA: DUF4235 domain-containing protein [Sporichthyaceae bacterium]|jgi:hypothetical protein|nr:DUF4235 domain-containing protein [Sporichthyaceae bacterium]
MGKVMYKPLSAVSGALAGVLAGRLFDLLWRRLGEGDSAPDPEEKYVGWGTVLLGAALEGVIYATVRAAVKRGGATGVEKVTGTWPGPAEAQAA